MGDVVSSILFQPPQKVRYLKENKVTWLRTNNGHRIPSVYIPYTSADSSDKGTGLTILYSHANAEDLADVYVWLKYLSRNLRCNVIGYDYAGYGQSDGEPSEENCYADIDAVYSHLIKGLGFKHDQIVLFGRSLGSGPSSYLASRTSEEGEPVAGLILHSPFTSIYRVMVDVGCTIVGDKFPNIDFARSIRCSALAIHGTNDRIIPHHHSQSLSQAFAQPCKISPCFLEGMGHNSIPDEFRPLFMDKVKEYLESYTNNNAPLDRKYGTCTAAVSSASKVKTSPAISSGTQIYLEEHIFNVYVKAIHDQWVEVHL